MQMTMLPYSTQEDRTLFGSGDRLTGRAQYIFQQRFEIQCSGEGFADLCQRLKLVEAPTGVFQQARVIEGCGRLRGKQRKQRARPPV